MGKGMHALQGLCLGTGRAHCRAALLGTCKNIRVRSQTEYRFANSLDSDVVAAIVCRVAENPLVVVELHFAIGQRSLPDLRVMVDTKMWE